MPALRIDHEDQPIMKRNVPHIAVRCQLFELGPWCRPRHRGSEIVIVFERDETFSLDAARAFLIANREQFCVEPNELRLRVCGTWRSGRRFRRWALLKRPGGLVGWYGPWRLDADPT